MKTKSNNWIKCSERMPGRGVDSNCSDWCLVYCDEDAIRLAYRLYNPFGSCWIQIDLDGNEFGLMDGVTHWQPLPNATIEEDNA